MEEIKMNDTSYGTDNNTRIGLTPIGIVCGGICVGGVCGVLCAS